MDKITVVVDPALEAMYQDDHNKWPHRLEVELEDGTVLTQQVEYPFGDFNNPFSWDDIHGKFNSLTGGILSADVATKLTSRLTALEEMQDINELFAI